MAEITQLLKTLPLGDAGAETCKALFATAEDGSADQILMLEDVEPSKDSFAHDVWPAAVVSLAEYFESALSQNEGAEAFWDSLQQAQNGVDKPHQKLIAVLFDRSRLGCYQSAVACLRWFGLRGGMQGLDSAKGVLLSGLFGMLKLRRLNSSVDATMQPLTEKADVAQALESFLRAALAFIEQQTEITSVVASQICDYSAQLFSSMDKLQNIFTAEAQNLVENVLVQLVKTKVNGRTGFMVTPVIEKLVPFVTLPEASKRQGGVDEFSRSRHTMALRVLLAIAERPSAFDRVFALIRHISRRPPSKAEFRRLALDGVEALLAKLPEDKQKEFIASVGSLSASKLVQHRVFAVEIADRLHSNSTNAWWRLDCTSVASTDADSTEGSANEEGEAADDVFSSKFSEPEEQGEDNAMQAAHAAGKARSPLIYALVDRVKDKIPQVRKAAIKGLVAALEAAEPSYIADVVHVVEVAYAEDTAAAAAAVGEDGLPLFADEDEIEHPVMTMILNRLDDEKPSVRSCAIKLAEFFGSFDIAHCNYNAIAQKCEDTSVSVRRQAINTIGVLRQKHPEHQELQETWLQCTLSRVKDNEKTVQMLCANIIHEYIFNAIIHAAEMPSESPEAIAEQQTLVTMMDNLDLLLLSCMQQAAAMLMAAGQLNQKFVTALKECIAWSPHMGTVAWALLQEVASRGGKKMTVDADFVVLSWENSVGENSLSEQTAGFILGTMVHVIDEMSAHAAASLAEHLLDLLQSFRCTPGLISSLIKCSIKLSEHNAKGNKTVARKHKMGWMTKLVQRCDACLRNFVFSRSELNTDAVVAHLHTLGELALVGVRDSTAKPLFSVPESTVTSLKTLVAPKSSSDSDSGSLTVKAFAFVALGKVAFRSQPLAKSCIGVFIRELMTAPEAVLRNNILVVLGDLCRHFTGLVDPYVGNMAHCLGDSHIGVRKNALLLLTELLLEDFIKWRGPLLFQFLSVLLDENDELRDLAHQAIFGLFSARDKNLVVNRFVGFVHVLNNSSLSRCEMDAADASATSAFFSRFYGQGDGRRFRYRLYRAVLEEMDSEQKFKISARLTADVLGATVDGALVLHGNDCGASSYNVLQDVFAILSSKAIQISHAAAAGAAAASSALGEAVSAETAFGVVKDKLLSNMSHKNAMQHTIPILIALRSRLQESRSPLLKDLNAYMTCIFRSHRSDVMKALAEDPQLAAEIKYDLMKFDEGQKQRQSTKRRRQSSGTPSKSSSTAGGLATPFSARASRSAAKSPLTECSVAKVSGGSVVKRRVSTGVTSSRSNVARNLNMSNLFTDSSNAANEEVPKSATKTRPNGSSRSPAHKRTFRDGSLANIPVSD